MYVNKVFPRDNWFASSMHSGIVVSTIIIWCIQQQLYASFSNENGINRLRVSILTSMKAGKDYLSLLLTPYKELSELPEGSYPQFYYFSYVISEKSKVMHFIHYVACCIP